MFAVGGQDRFRVKLDAINGILLVAQAHHLAFFGESSDFQTVWDGFLNDQGMIAGSLERCGDADKQSAAVMVNPWC